MGVYITADIKVDDGARIQIKNGDLEMATSKRSHLQALHWLIACMRGDVTEGDTVADLGAYAGHLNIPRTHRNMEAQTRRAIAVQRVFSPGDVQVAVIPISLEGVAVTARMRGVFFEVPEVDDEE